MAVPLSPQELMKKRLAIFKHQSQKDLAPFPGTDKSKFEFNPFFGKSRGEAKVDVLWCGAGGVVWCGVVWCGVVWWVYLCGLLVRDEFLDGGFDG